MTGKRKDAKDTNKTRKPRPWFFDPSVFEPLPRASFFRRHLLDRMRSIGKYILYSAAFVYPLILVGLGVFFGGLVFWSGFVGSIAIMWLLISKTGYARNFSGWGVGNIRILGLLGAFGVALAFFYGLVNLRESFFPIFGGVLFIVVIVGLWRFSTR